MFLSLASCRVSLKPPRLRIFRVAYWKSISQFRVIEHVVPAQHTRHWPRGTDVGYENALKIAVKQYIPKSNDSPQVGDVTFIAAHANGFPKVSGMKQCAVYVLRQ